MSDKDFLKRVAVFAEMAGGYIRAVEAAGASPEDVADATRIISQALTGLVQDAPTADVCGLDPDVWGTLFDGE